MCLRCVDNELVAHEDFLGFYKIPNIAADTIVSVVKDALTDLLCHWINSGVNVTMKQAMCWEKSPVSRQGFRNYNLKLL